LKEADWAQFRELVTGMGESELAAFIRDLRDHAAFLRNGRPSTLPLESPDPPPFRGALAMSDDELSAFIRDNKIEFPGPTPESEAEAEWEAKLFEAIESGEIGRKKPGRIPGKLLARASDKEIADECLIKARGNTRSAMTAFINRVKKGMSEKALKSGSADTTAERRWYAVTEAHGRTRRVRRNNFRV
jgi:hypothetical protein